MEPSPELVSKIRQTLSAHPEVEVALLFGSRVRGQEKPGSDLDVAIDGADIDVLELIHELSVATGLEVDVVDLRRSGYPFPLLQILLREGVVIYEGSRHAAARWRTQAVLRWEDFRPNWVMMRDAYLKKLATGPAPQEATDG